jgi:hypothetical protein
MSHEVAAELGIERPARAVMWGVNTTMVELLMRTVLPDAPLRVRGPGPGPRGVRRRRSSHGPGQGAIRRVLVPPDGHRPDRDRRRLVRGEHRHRHTPAPRASSDAIGSASVPARCAARVGGDRLGRGDRPGDFQAAGGCYNARLARGGDLDRGFAISRHSWGIAIDFNPSTNRFGQQTSLSEEFGQVLRELGFRLGRRLEDSRSDALRVAFRSCRWSVRQACADRLANLHSSSVSHRSCSDLPTDECGHGAAGRVRPGTCVTAAFPFLRPWRGTWLQQWSR